MFWLDFQSESLFKTESLFRADPKADFKANSRRIPSDSDAFPSEIICYELHFALLKWQDRRLVALGIVEIQLLLLYYSSFIRTVLTHRSEVSTIGNNYGSIIIGYAVLFAF